MIAYAPIIGYRYVLFSLKRKDPRIHRFYCSSEYCIEGTLNSINWNVENALFVRLNKCPMLKLGPQEKIFNVSRGTDRLVLECFGIKKKLSQALHLNIITLKPQDFTGVALRGQSRIINTPQILTRNNTAISRYKLVGKKTLFHRVRFAPIIINSLTSNELSNMLNSVHKTESLQEINEIKNHK